MFEYYVLFQAEYGIRYLGRSRGLGDVYKRQAYTFGKLKPDVIVSIWEGTTAEAAPYLKKDYVYACLLYTSDAADERSSVDLGGRRIIKKKKHRAQVAGSAISGPVQNN